MGHATSNQPEAVLLINGSPYPIRGVSWIASVSLRVQCEVHITHIGNIISWCVINRYLYNIVHCISYMCMHGSDHLPRRNCPPYHHTLPITLNLLAASNWIMTVHMHIHQYVDMFPTKEPGTSYWLLTLEYYQLYSTAVLLPSHQNMTPLQQVNPPMLY